MRDTRHRKVPPPLNTISTAVGDNEGVVRPETSITPGYESAPWTRCEGGSNFSMLWDSLTTTDQPALGPDRDAAPGGGEGDAIAAVAAPAQEMGVGTAASADTTPTRSLYDR